MKIIRGDIIKALKNKEIDILAHGCNCRNGFGSGIAGQLAIQAPKAKNAYHQFYKEGKAKLGNVQFVESEIGTIANCMTQLNYGNAQRTGIVYLDYRALYDVLVILKEQAKRGKKVGIPKIGCGLAGGDWNLVKNMIDDVFVGEEIYVYIY